jgi:hypothetical protein
MAAAYGSIFYFANVPIALVPKTSSQPIRASVSDTPTNIQHFEPRKKSRAVVVRKKGKLRFE